MEEEMSTILRDLNSEQKKAVECVDGPVLIVAGAGSGKTRVLTSRIAYMIEKGVDPARIMALTFTKKAAGEMKERIALMVGERAARRIYMGTFHSVFIRFLREFSASIGYPSSFTIYDQSDSTSAVKNCIKQLGLDDSVYKPKDVLARISKAKNNLVTAAAYARNQQAVENDRIARRPDIWKIYSLYAENCLRSGVMDFDDILLNMNILLRDDQKALEEIASRFTHILVDEYQDTNYAQYLILRKLSEKHRNICVVGDDSQSIYAFRGARIQNILGFKNDFPEMKVFRLENNYRSTAVIVEAANSLIEKNASRLPKKCVAMGETGEKIRLVRGFTEQEEAILIASSIISRIRTDQAVYQDFAILYRTNAQSRALEEALRTRNLPYRIYSGNSFFERSEVKDMMAYLKLVVNPDDDESFRRVVNKPARGIGDTSVSALVSAASSSGLSLFRAACSDNLASYGLKTAAIARIREFCKLVLSFSVRAQSEDAHEVASALATDSGLYLYYKSDNSVEGQSRAANVEELLNSVAQFRDRQNGDFLEGLLAEGGLSDASQVDPGAYPVVKLSDYLEDVSLLSNVDVEDEDSANKISLMTAHSAKGLEFPYVYVAGMEENLFPSVSMTTSAADVEEERRLFYVALTRAKKAVTLTFASTRMRNGKHESNPPSRFLREIDSRYILNPLRRPGMEEDYDDSEEEAGFKFGQRYSSSMGGGRQRSFGTSYQSSGGFSRSAPGYQRFQGQPQHPSPVRPSGISRESVASRPLPPKIPDSEFVPMPMDQVREGMIIEHNRFGKGKVVEISGKIPELKAKIAFDDYGDKILLLKYAKIRIPLL